MKEQIIAEEELTITDTHPEWHLESDIAGVEYLIDFNITKRIIFKMSSGKTYYFSLVRVEDEDTSSV